MKLHRNLMFNCLHWSVDAAVEELNALANHPFFTGSGMITTQLSQISILLIMTYQTAYSSHSQVAGVITQIKQQLGEIKPVFILYFASPHYDAQQLSSQMEKAFPDSRLVGCTTSGEITTGKMLDNSVVAMAFGPEVLADVRVGVITDVSEDKGEGIKKAFADFGQHYGESVEHMDYEKYIGIVLIDGLSGAEERINDQIGNLTSLAFVGGSTGDNLQFKQTHVFANGKAYTNAAVLALLKPKAGFSVLKTQSFTVTPKVLRVTKANESDRRVVEFNGKPATQAYAELLGVPENELSKHYFSNPLGFIFDENDPFVRSPRVVEGSDVLFYCSVKEGMDLHLLKSKDIVEETQKALNQKYQQMNGFSAIINFNCILRTLELKEKKQAEAYGNLFKNTPTVGFSTYGESYIGHINQTATMLLFK